MMLIYVAGFMSVDQSLEGGRDRWLSSKGKTMWHVVIPLMRSSFVQHLHRAPPVASWVAT